jgi:integral membrane protein (TIGR01906 family)
VSRLLPVATALVILGLAVVPFLTPAWVGFEQDRTEVTAWTGFSRAEVTTITSSIVADLVLARGDFDVTRAGAPVLTEPERSHMRDVRGVFAGFAVLVLVAAGFLVYAARTARERDSRRALWSGLRRGAAGLAVAIAIIGAISVVAFDAAFEAFHRVFFPPGSYSFDPATSRLVQLFPDRFWSETTLAVGAVGLVLALGVTWLASRRLAVTVDPAATAALSVSGATR